METLKTGLSLSAICQEQRTVGKKLRMVEYLMSLNCPSSLQMPERMSLIFFFCQLSVSDASSSSVPNWHLAALNS